MAILNPIFLQHGIHLNTSELVKLQGILHVHSRYTGMNLTLTWGLPFRIFLGFSRTIICCGYCSVSFQSFALHHLLTSTVCNIKKL